MFIYITRFEGRAGLCKIGSAKDAKVRLKHLEKSHGPVVSFKKFKIGKGCVRFEKFIHDRFEDKKAPLKDKVDGHTEFFDKSVADAAETVLQSIALPMTDEESATYLKERRDFSFAVRKAGEAVEACIKVRQSAIEHKATLEFNSKGLMYKLVEGRVPERDKVATFNESCLFCFKLVSAIDLGFDREEVMENAVNYLRAKGRRVTLWRLKVAYALIYESQKRRKLEVAEVAFKRADGQLKYAMEHKERIENEFLQVGG